MSVFASLVERLAALLQPLFHGSATAAAIVLFTVAVRLALHPLARAAARGQRARMRLAPRVAELRRKYGRNPERLQRAVMDLYAGEQVSPFAGFLPSLLQLPAFFLMYHLFTGGGMEGHALLAAPLGGRWTGALADGGLFGAAGLVYLALFMIVTGLATYTYRRARREMGVMGVMGEAAGAELPGAVTRLMPLLGYGTLISVAVLPLAAGLYVVTSTAWGAAERAYLFRGGALTPEVTRA
ncbi:membrane protein insertase YidC [Streptomyces sp. NPDC045431]|uniref:YidC/Oxa1 family membrane protein insertase n=1 Tax=Streptomyces sp. NPDC045431 TaxID=3155613 RepID=UPI0033DC8F5C